MFFLALDGRVAILNIDIEVHNAENIWVNMSMTRFPLADGHEGL